MTKPLLILLPLSVAAHVAAGAAALVFVTRDPAPRTLFIELEETITIGPPAPASGVASGGASRSGGGPRRRVAPEAHPSREHSTEVGRADEPAPPAITRAGGLDAVPAPDSTPPAPSVRPSVSASPVPFVPSPAVDASAWPERGATAPAASAGQGGGTAAARSGDRGGRPGPDDGSGGPELSGGARGAVAHAATGSGPGPGVDDAAYVAYLNQLWRRLRDVLDYPAAARRRNLVGTVHVEIVIRTDGTVGDVSVAKSSSHPILDGAAVDAIRRLPPLPFPAGLPPRTLRARVPVVFELR